MFIKYILASIVLFGIVFIANSSVTNTSHVIDAAGKISVAGTYTNIGVTAQSGGVYVSAGGSLVNYAGFLNTFILHPNLDIDGDGIANELDTDNDNDNLTDYDEIAGSSFEPVTCTDVNVYDTDGDGVSDGAEAIAGSDPTDSSIFLHITSIKTSGNDLILGWQARSNRTYCVRSSPDIVTEPEFTNIVASSLPVTNNTTPPWYVTTNYYRHVGAVSNEIHRFYRIETSK